MQRSRRAALTAIAGMIPIMGCGGSGDSWAVYGQSTVESNVETRTQREVVEPTSTGPRSKISLATTTRTSVFWPGRAIPRRRCDRSQGGSVGRPRARRQRRAGGHSGGAYRRGSRRSASRYHWGLARRANGTGLVIGDTVEEAMIRNFDPVECATDMVDNGIRAIVDGSSTKDGDPPAIEGEWAGHAEAAAELDVVENTQAGTRCTATDRGVWVEQ